MTDRLAPNGDLSLSRLATTRIEVSPAAPGAFTDGDPAFHRRRRDPVMAWSPPGGGRLVEGSAGEGRRARPRAPALARGVDAAAVAVAFLLRHPARILPVLGTNSLARIRRIADAGRVELSRTEWFRLYEAALGQEVP